MDVDYAQSHARRRRAVWILIGMVPALLAGFALVGFFTPAGDPGSLDEPLYPLRPGAGLPRLEDVTGAAGMGEWVNRATTQASGGLAGTDLNGDGWLDVVVAGGSVEVFFGSEDGRFTSARGAARLGPGAVGVAPGDLDDDGLVDLVVTRSAADDLVVWGGPWLDTGDVEVAELTALAGTPHSSSAVIVEVTGDGRADIVRLGYGAASPESDLILGQTGERTFTPRPLPNSNRRSLAVAVADIDGDGLVDLWVTRDVGWRDGGDSVYSRLGNPAGPWTDIADQMGADLAIDGMGVTLADVDGDRHLDAYLSDIGDNELLVGSRSGFAPARDLGVGRIRPPGAGDRIVSSSWSSGFTDVNLDGIGDLVVVNGGFPNAEVANKIDNTLILLDDPPAIFLGRGDGTYADAWPLLGLSWSGAARGLLLADYDRDGDTDIFISRMRGGLSLYRNDTEGPSLALAAPATCQAVGATIDIEDGPVPVLASLAGTTLLGHHPAEFVVGGPPGPRRVAVRWPDGTLTQATATVSDEHPRVELACPPSLLGG